MRRSVSLALSLLALAACGETPENAALPPLPEKLGAADAPAAIKASQTSWESLAGALGIGNNQAPTEPELRAQLATPSSFLATARKDDFTKLLGKLGQSYASTAYATRCASIEAVQSLGSAKLVDPATGKAEDFAGAGLYLMKYKLQTDAKGKAEETARSGLLVVPTTGTATSVVAAYAHGGDFGLGYGEVAAAFGQLQGNHVIVAPTFPGEPLCKQATDTAARGCDAAGVLVEAGAGGEAYDKDADELLGMFDCATRAGLGLVDAKVTDATGSEKTISGILKPLLKRHDAGSAAAVSQGIIVGASRGGLVLQVALAKTGAALQALATATAEKPAPLGEAFVSASYFSCAAVVSGPASFAFAEFRLMLEQWVKGRLASTSFVLFPGVASLAAIFDTYRAGTADAEAAALAIVRRDAPLTAPLQLGALRNWAKFTAGTSAGGPGALLMMHGVNDRVVPISQAQINYNVLLQASQSAATGAALVVRAFSPKAEYLDAGKLKAAYYDHGDKAFFDSTAIIPGDFISAAVTSTTLSSQAGEAAANGLAQKIFSVPTPSAAQLKAARGYVLAGLLTNEAVPKPVAATDATGAETIHLTEEAFSPATTFGAWRLGACTASLSAN